MNKRELKKQIHALCGGIACDCVQIGQLSSRMTPEALGALVVKAARAQQKAISHLSVSFDKVERDFANPAEYRKARHAFNKMIINKLGADLNADLVAIAKELNAALPKKK